MGGIRIKYSRQGDVRYISHLDIMKMFERALRRAEIPVMHSQGFNPHPQMVFGMPLPVGVSSEAEYADFMVEGDTGADDAAEFVKRLGKQLPEGVAICGFAAFNRKDGSRDADNIMRIIAAASYAVKCRICPIEDDTGEEEKEKTEAEIKRLVVNFLGLDSICVTKETKNKSGIVDVRSGIVDTKPRIVDIKPMILNLDAECIEPGVIIFNMTVKAGNEANLKPEVLIGAFAAESGIRIKAESIHRTSLFADLNGVLTDPLKMPGMLE